MQKPSYQPRRRLRVVLWVLLFIAAALIVLPWAASPWITKMTNRRLASLPGYDARVASVRIALWRCAVQVEGFEMSDKSRPADKPFLKVERSRMTLLPAALIRGKLSGHGKISGSELFIIQDEPRDAKDATEEDKVKSAKERAERARRWQNVLQERFAVEISHFEIDRTTIHFVDRSMPGNPEMTIEDFHLVAKNLNSRKKPDEDSPAHVEATGRFAGGGTLRAEASLSPQKEAPQFTALLEVKDLALPPLREFLKSYLNVDVSRGTFEVYIEVESKAGHYTGYLKPFFRDLEFKALSDPEKNLVQNTATKVASAVTNLLKNDEQKVATKVPFEGDLTDNKVDVWTTVENLLRNAFVESLREGFEGQKPTG